MKSTTSFWLQRQFMLGLILLFFTPQIVAVEQFNQSQCLQLNTELEQLRLQQREGLSLHYSERIKADEQRLTQQLHYHCAHPKTEQVTGRKPTITKKNNPHRTPQQRHRRVHKVVATAAIPARQLTFSSVTYKNRYQGSQLQAWLNYYREPHFCYGVRLTPMIVVCAELRQQAQQEFERQWQQQHPNILSDQ